MPVAMPVAPADLAANHAPFRRSAGVVFFDSQKRVWVKLDGCEVEIDPTTRSRVGRDRYDGDDSDTLLPGHFIWAVMPKNAVGTGSVVLSVGLEDLFTIDPGERGEFVRIEPGVVRIQFEKAQRLFHLFAYSCFGRIVFEHRELPVSSRRE